nr:LPS-assembly protein LptD [Bacteroidia bacterium]
PPSGQSSLVSWSINNTVEAKIRDNKDSINHEKKIHLIDMFTISSAYNTAIHSFKWQTINMTGRTKLFKYLNVNYTGTLDPYQIDDNGVRVEKFQFNKNGNIGRLTNYTWALSTSLKSKNNNSTNQNNKTTKDETDDINKHPNAYVDFTIPWTLNIFYNFSYVKQGVAPVQKTQSLMFSGDVNLTPKWKIGFNSGFDFKAHQFTFTQLNIYRDLHCWEMKITWVPFGPRQSYMVDINVKSAVLQDLKLTRRRDWYDMQ